MARKLRNIDTIRKILDNEHSSQTRTIVSSNTEDISETRKVGDAWVDVAGIKWIQKDGFVIREGKMKALRQSLYKPVNCLTDECGHKKMNRIDKKMISIHGMCMDCVAKSETQMRADGTYREYEKNILKVNALKWLKDAEKDVDLVAKYLSTGDIVLEDGTTEAWEGGDSEKMREKILTNFAEFKKDFLSKLEK